MAATTEINAPEHPGNIAQHPVAAATNLFAGTLVALDTSGNVVPAADTAGLRVVGRAEHNANNTDGAAGDITINVKRGVFRYANSATAAVDADDKGKIVYVEDNQTVAETSTNKIKAGRVFQVDADGVWVDTREAHDVTQVVTLASTNGTAAGAADLAALKTEAEKIGDDVRAIHAALQTLGLLV
jgi:hypothetical protein